MLPFRFSKLNITSTLIIGRIFGFGIKLFIPILIVRFFSTEDFGLFQKILGTIVLITSYFSFGIDQSILFFFNKKNESFLFKNFILTFLISFLVSILSFFAFYFFQSYLVDNTYSFSTIVKVVFIIFFSINNLPLDQFFIVKNFKKSLLIFSILNGLSRVIILLIFLVYLDNDVNSLINFLLTFESLKYLLFTFYFLIKEKNNLSFIKIYSDFKVILKYTLPLHISNLLGTIGRSLDRNILLYIATSTQFAFYSIAMFRIPYIDIVKGSIGHVLINDLSSNKITEKNKNVLWNLAAIKLSSIVYPSIIFFFINAETILQILFTEKYISASYLYRILILSFLFAPLFTGQVLQAFNLKKELFKSELLTLFLSIILNSILIYKFNVMGACIAYTIVTLSNSLFQFYYLKLDTSLNFNNSLLSEVFMIVLIYISIGLSAHLICSFLFFSLIISMVFQSIIFIVIFYKKSLKLFI